MSETYEIDLGRETLISLSSKAVTMLFGAAGVLIFARVLDPVGLGVYYLSLTAGKITAKATTGVADAIKKLISEVNETPEEYLGVGLLFHLLLTGAVFLAVVAISPVVELFLDIPNLVVSTTIVVFSFGLFQVSQGLYYGLGNPGKASWVDTARSVLTTLSQVVFLLVLDWGSFGLIAGFSVAAVATTLPVLVITRVRPTLPSWHTLRRTYCFARWSVPDALVSNAYSRMDLLLLGVIAGPESVGYYETALRLVQPAAFLASSISGPLTVKASGLSSLNRNVLGDLKNAVSYAALLAIPIFFGTLAIPRPLMAVFSSEFIPGWRILIALSVLLVFRTLGSPFTSILNAINKPDLEFRLSVGVAGLNLVLAVVLGFSFGAIGVVVASVLAELIRFIHYLWYILDIFGEVALTKPIYMQILSGVIMFLLVDTLVSQVQPCFSLYCLAGAIGFGGIVYFTTLTLLSAHFRTTVWSALRTVVPVTLKSRV